MLPPSNKNGYCLASPEIRNACPLYTGKVELTHHVRGIGNSFTTPEYPCGWAKNQLGKPLCEEIKR